MKLGNTLASFGCFPGSRSAEPLTPPRRECVFPAVYLLQCPCQRGLDFPSSMARVMGSSLKNNDEEKYLSFNSKVNCLDWLNIMT